MKPWSLVALLALLGASAAALAGQCTAVSGDRRVALLELYTSNNLSNRVTRGENRGKHLQHDFVVRELAGPFRVSPGESMELNHTFQLNPGWKRTDLHVVAFAQNSTSGEILQALALPACR